MSFSNLIFLSFFSQVSDFESFIGSLNDQGYLLKKGSRVYQLQTMWEESLWRTFFRPQSFHWADGPAVGRHILSWAAPGTALVFAGLEIPLKKIKLGSCKRTNWYVVLLPGSSCRSAIPKGTVQGHNAPHHPRGAEGVFLYWHYYSATLDPQMSTQKSFMRGWYELYF